MVLSIIALVPVLSAVMLIESATNSVARRIATADPARSLSRFVGYPGGAESDRFDFNPDFWLKGTDFSCVSPWNSGGGNTRAGTAISRRHVVFARHFPLWRGVRIVFVGEDGGVCPARIEATKAIADSDIMIGTLDYELTSNIKPARILPPDYEKYIGDGKGLPIVTFNREEKAFLAESPGISTNAMYMMGRGLPKRSRQRSFQESLIVGDSGNPAFMLIGKNPILIYCLKSGGSGMGPALHRYAKEIQAAMDELCPGYKLETFDFSTVGK